MLEQADINREERAAEDIGTPPSSKIGRPAKKSEDLSSFCRRRLSASLTGYAGLGQLVEAGRQIARKFRAKGHEVCPQTGTSLTWAPPQNSYGSEARCRQTSMPDRPGSVGRLRNGRFVGTRMQVGAESYSICGENAYINDEVGTQS